MSTEVTTRPLQMKDDVVASWSAYPGWLLHGLIGMVRWLPRGRGVIPRWYGRTFGRKMRRSIRMRNGSVIAIDPRNLEVYVSNALGFDYNVEHIVRAVRSLLSMPIPELSPTRSTVFYDVGANAGFIAMNVAQLNANDVQVYAFEPQPALANCIALSARLSRLNNLRVFQTMLDNTSGDADLFVPTLGVAASSVWWNSQTPGVRTLRCPVETLDRLLAAGVIQPPSLIKIDVEGAEHAVLEGAKALLSQYRPIVVFESWATNACQVKMRERIIEQLSSIAHYNFYFVDESEFRPMDDVHDARFVDIAAIPQGLVPPKSF